MAAVGAKVERPIVPVSIHLSDDAAELADPEKRPVRVSDIPALLMEYRS
jgi:hypothetical protein